MCFSHRKKPSCIVAILSSLMLALSIAMIVLSFKFTGADIFKAFKGEDEELDKLANIIFYILCAFSFIALVLGIWGITLIKCTNLCCPVVYGVCLLPTWIITIVFGAVIAWFSNSSPATIQSFCNLNEDSDSILIEYGRKVVNSYDGEIGKLVNEIMCSRECPCADLPNKSTWLSMDEHFLNQIGRTKLATSALYTPFDFSGEGAVIYKNFASCYKDMLAGKTSRVQPEVAEFRNRFSENQLDLAIDFANYFEEAYKCSGICTAAIFYYSLPVVEGVPSEVCLMYLKQEVQDSLALMGIFSVVTGLVMLFTFLFQYCLWADYDSK